MCNVQDKIPIKIKLIKIVGIEIIFEFWTKKTIAIIFTIYKNIFFKAFCLKTYVDDETNLQLLM